MEEALESNLQSCDPKVRRAGAESIGVYVSKGGDAAAERVVLQLSSELGPLSSSCPEFRAAGVLALQHLMLAAPSPKGWTILAACLRDCDHEVRNSTRLALLSLAAKHGLEVTVPVWRQAVGNECIYTYIYIYAYWSIVSNTYVYTLYICIHIYIYIYM